MDQGVAALIEAVSDRHWRNIRLGGFGLGLSLIVVIALAGCSSHSDETSHFYPTHRAAIHVVQPGDTLYHVAQEYKISVDALMAANEIADPRELHIGERLIIPGHHSAGTGEQDFATASALGLGNPWDVVPADRQFAWPVAAGTVSSPFGMRHGAMHDGIDIAAPLGTPILAADSGTVIFAGRLRGYGNVVIIQHSANYATVYGHNERNVTSAGATVARGQEIAEMGMTGRATGPNLHFEVRYENHPQNPLAYLPPPVRAGGITFARNGVD
ncbi:MAG TPA: M23 family metallopeptidase [Candidatus Binataceae bacterium]|nr:M23 family metallopeptidase [Candidatus Binataceae bacterium]